MKLVDMKLDAKEQKAEAGCDIAMSKPLYPWGLSIELNEDAISKLGIKELPDADDQMMVTARVCVTNVGSRSTGEGTNRSLSLQIEALALSDVVDDEKPDAADTLYKKA